MRCVTDDCDLCLVEQMEKQNKGHECTELCDIDGENRRTHAEWHRQAHQPVRCTKCRAVLADGLFRERDGEKHTICANGSCVVLRCRYCDADRGGWGPVFCPVCNPQFANWRPEKVKRIHRQYAQRGRRR